MPCATQGALGIKVKIILTWAPSGKNGPKKPQPDRMSVVDPRADMLSTVSVSSQKVQEARAVCHAPASPHRIRVSAAGSGESGYGFVKTFNKII